MMISQKKSSAKKDWSLFFIQSKQSIIKQLMWKNGNLDECNLYIMVRWPSGSLDDHSTEKRQQSNGENFMDGLTKPNYLWCWAS